MQVYLDFQTGDGWEEITPFVSDRYTIIHRAASPEMKHSVNLANFSIFYNADLFNKISAAITARTDVLVLFTYMEGAVETNFFYGFYRPNTTKEYNGIVDLQTIDIEAKDFSDYLDVEVGVPGIAWEDYQIMNATVSGISIIHSLFSHVGLDHALIDSSVVLSGVVGAFTSQGDDDKVIDLIDTLMFEQGYVANWNEEGIFSPIPWIPASGISLSFTFDDANIIGQITETRNMATNEGAQVIWYELRERENTRLFTDDSVSEANGQLAGYAVLRETYYPPEANTIDDTTGLPQVVYQEYTDDGIRFATSAYAAAEYDIDFSLTRADFSEILITRDHVLSEHITAGLTRPITEFYNKKARVAYWNPLPESQLLYYMHIDATVIYKASQQKCTVEYVPNTRKLSKYDSRFVFTREHADRLCRAMCNMEEVGNVQWTFQSGEKVAEGSFVNLTLANGTNATAFVLERAYDGYSGLYSYTLLAVTFTYRAVAGRDTSVTRFGMASELARLAARPSYPSLRITGNDTFTFRGSFPLPNPSNITLLTLVEGLSGAVTYQWYYRNALGETVEMLGATDASLAINYADSYLLPTDTVLSCCVNGEWWTSYTVKKRTIDEYRLQIGGDTANISYGADGTNPVPAANQEFFARLYINDVEQMDATYLWTASGCLSIASGETSQTVTVDVADTKQVGNTFVSCAATASGNTVTEQRDIAVSYYDSLPPPQYLGKFVNTSGTGHPEPRNNGDWWLIYGTDDVYSQRGLYYDVDTVPTIIDDTDLGAQGAMVMAAIADIGWAINSGLLPDMSWITYYETLGANVAFIQSLFTNEIEVSSGGSIRYYNGAGVQRRYVELAEDHIDWVDAPDVVPPSGTTLQGRIGRLGVGETILMDGDFEAIIESPWSPETTISTGENAYPTQIQLSNGERRIAYREKVTGAIHERIWDGSVWGDEIIITANPGSYPAYIEYPDGTLKVYYRLTTPGYLYERTWSGTAWVNEATINGAGSSNITTVLRNTGEARIAYLRTADSVLVERVFNGSIWGDESVINNADIRHPSYIELANGELRIAYARTSDGYLVERIWSGTAWGAETVINSASTIWPTYIQFVDGQLRIIYALASGGSLVERTWNGSIWGLESVINAGATTDSSAIQLSDGSISLSYTRGVGANIYERTLRRYARIGAGVTDEGVSTDGRSVWEKKGNNRIHQEGWTYITGDGTDNNEYVTVTLPVEMLSYTGLGATVIGVNTSNPTAIDDTTSATTGAWATARILSSTQISVGGLGRAAITSGARVLIAWWVNGIPV